MKTAFIVQGGTDLVSWIAFARDEKIDGVELMFHNPTPEDFQNVSEQKRILDDHGIEAAAVGIWGIGLADPQESGTSDSIKRAIDYAAELDSCCLYTGAGEPEGDDPVGRLADVYENWATAAQEAGLKLGVYLGHKGSFIYTEAQLADACSRIARLGLKLDPIGIIRNLKADPYDILFRHGDRLVLFHVKDRLILADGEIEPPPGLGELDWGSFFGILYHHLYDGYISVEPHGGFWSRPDERRKAHIKLTLRHMARFML